MFTTDAFGRRIRCLPRLRFVEPPEGGEGGEGGEGAGDLGFPANTPVAEMTAEQKAAYYRAESKKQQKAREAAERELAAAKPKAEQFDALEEKNKTDQEKAVEAAREEARREGEVIGSEKYLKEAVKGRFQALTGKTDEDVETAFAHVDAASFVTDKGDLDVAAIKKFADTFGPKGTTSTDPVRDAANRSRPAGGTGGGQSMQERREAAAARMSKKKTPNT